MKNGTLKRVLSLVMALAMLFTLLPTAAFAAGTKTIYLDPGGSSLWHQANAKFFSHAWNDSDEYVDAQMTDENCDGIYETSIPDNYNNIVFVRNWTKVIFCRLNPANTNIGWENKWNQTADLTISGNCYTITGWDSGKWSTITPTITDTTFTVAGEAGLCGASWDTTATANDMTKNAEGLYEKVYTDVAAGTYKFKVVANHTWEMSWGNASGGDASVIVAEAGSTVTILFNAATKAITTKAKDVICRLMKAGYTGACGLEYGPLLEPVESLKTFRKLYADLL